ncbi:MAG: hypothetical protein H6R19_2359 [Proteobacteria bacterium]|nr:hypothetical protein [Pseudomonadota bacterium]
MEHERVALVTASMGTLLLVIVLLMEQYYPFYGLLVLLWKEYSAVTASPKPQGETT